MIFNGHSKDSLAEIDNETMTQIQVMYSDGVIGNHGVLNQLGMLCNGIFNYLRSENVTPYKLETILGAAYDYLYKPLTEAEKNNQVSNALLSFMSSAPEFQKKVQVKK